MTRFTVVAWIAAMATAYVRPWIPVTIDDQTIARRGFAFAVQLGWRL